MTESELYKELGELTKSRDNWNEKIPYVSSLLTSSSVKIKAKALWLLGEMGLAYPLLIAESVPDIAAFLDSPEPILRERSLNALGRIGRANWNLIEPFWTDLFRFASDEEAKVKLSFIWASENIAANFPDAYESYMQIFSKLLYDSDDKVRMEAPEIFRVLGKRRPEFVQPYLEQLRIISETDSNRVVRIHCIGAIKAAAGGKKPEQNMIETKRLKIYPASEKQMKACVSAQKDEEMKKAYTEMLEGCLKHPDQWNWYAMWMIELKDGTHIGDLCFKGLDPNGITEIGYGILDDYQGQGYATEAVKAALDWALRDPTVTAVEAETDPGNMASQRVLEKCGFVPNGKTGEEGPRFTHKPLIREVRENKRDYLALLLLADEQENMIDLYLDRGTMYVLETGHIAVGECVVTDEGDGVLEIQSLAVDERYQGKGYGKMLIEFVADRYRDQYKVLQVGTGDSPLTVPFYESCGFVQHHVIKNYIVDHYDHPIYEVGKQLIDKVYLRRAL